MLNYFVAYCNHFNKRGENLDVAHPERSYDKSFHKLASQPGNSGYKILKCLHDNSDDPVFATARQEVTLHSVADWKTMHASVEATIRQPNCLLLLFLNQCNPPNISFQRLENHSIVVGHDGLSLYYFDTALPQGQNLRAGPSRMLDFGALGDAYLVTKRA